MDWIKHIYKSGMQFVWKETALFQRIGIEKIISVGSVEKTNCVLGFSSNILVHVRAGIKLQNKNISLFSQKRSLSWNSIQLSNQNLRQIPL